MSALRPSAGAAGIPQGPAAAGAPPGWAAGGWCGGLGLGYAGHLQVGQRQVDDAVEAARARERRVERGRPVGGRHDDHAGVVVEAVHLRQQLVDGLHALCAAARTPKLGYMAHRCTLPLRARLQLFLGSAAASHPSLAVMHLRARLGVSNVIEGHHKHTRISHAGTRRRCPWRCTSAAGRCRQTRR